MSETFRCLRWIWWVAVITFIIDGQFVDRYYSGKECKCEVSSRAGGQIP